MCISIISEARVILIIGAEDLSVPKSLKNKTGLFLKCQVHIGLISVATLFLGKGLWAVSSHLPSGNCSEALYLCAALAVCFL